MSTKRRFMIHAPRDEYTTQSIIPLIRGIRILTGTHLKEAKILAENCIDHPVHASIHDGCSESDIANACQIIREDGGGTVTIIPASSPVRDDIGKSISGLAAWATTSENYDLAHSLINILETHCPGWNQDE